MRKVKLSFTEDDAFIPRKGDQFCYEGRTYYIHDFKEDEEGHDKYDVFHLTLSHTPVGNDK
jgi:hypothetical protein